jgi:hypothetical protein
MPTLEGTNGGCGTMGIETGNPAYTYIALTDGSLLDTLTYTIDTTTTGNGQVSSLAFDVFSDRFIHVYRYYQEFDTSEINRAPASASFDPYYISSTLDTAQIVCVETKFESDGALEETDWDNHLNLGYTHKTYTETFPANDGMGRKNINFTQDGLNAIRDLDKLQLVCLEAEYDYARIELPTSGLFSRKTTLYQEVGVDDYGLGPTLTYTMGEIYKISSGKVDISGGKVTIK